MTLRRSLNISFVVLAIVLLGAGVLGYREQAKRVERQASGVLKTMLMLRESVLRSYFESLRSEVILWSGQSTIIEIMRRVNAEFDRKGSAGAEGVGDAPMRSLGSSSQGSWQSSLNDRAIHFAAHHRYYDIFFIGEAGDVLFTVTKEDDLGTNVVDGPHADSGLGRVFRALRDSDDRDHVAFEDFSSYAPSAGEPAAFIGSPVHSEGRRIGYYVVQIPAEPIDSIMQFSAGMGETGETYLVGRDGLMRSNSRFFEESSILKTSVSGRAVELALGGEAGLMIMDDYRGVPVFSAYRPFDFEGVRWAVLAEQDVEEVYAPSGEMLQWIVVGYGALVLVGILLRWMLLNAVVPGALAAFFGLSVLDAMDDS